MYSRLKPRIYTVNGHDRIDWIVSFWLSYHFSILDIGEKTLVCYRHQPLLLQPPLYQEQNSLSHVTPSNNHRYIRNRTVFHQATTTVISGTEQTLTCDTKQQSARYQWYRGNTNITSTGDGQLLYMTAPSCAAEMKTKMDQQSGSHVIDIWRVIVNGEVVVKRHNQRYFSHICDGT